MSHPVGVSKAAIVHKQKSYQEYNDCPESAVNAQAPPETRPSCIKKRANKQQQRSNKDDLLRQIDENPLVYSKRLLFEHRSHAHMRPVSCS